MPGGPGGPGAPPSSAGRAASGAEVEIQSYKAANWLIVLAPKEKMPKVAQLVDELDQELPQEIKLRVIPVKYAAAEDLARQLENLAQKRYSKKVREVIEIASDQRSNSLVILSSEQNYTAIQTIVKELDSPESVQTKTEWFELKYADAEDLAEQMNTLYQGQNQQSYVTYYFGSVGRSEVKPRFVAEKRSNSLIAIAPPNEFDRIREVVERLDKKIEGDQVAPRMFVIRNNDAKELADVLNRVFGVEETGQQNNFLDYIFGVQSSKKAKVGRLYGQVRFDPLIISNAIVVTTNNKENFPIIASFIARLDQDSPESANLLVITLKNAPALDLARQLNGLFGREGTRLPARATQAQQPNQQQGNQQQSSQQQAQQGAPSSEEEQYSFLYAPEPKAGQRPISESIGRVRVVADTRTNSLMITTPAQNHAEIRALVAELDQPSPKVYVAVRLIEVSRTNASYIGLRFTSTPSLFTSQDFDNGVQANLGINWQTAFHNGVLTAAVSPAVLAQFVIEHFDSRILSDTSLTMDNNRHGEIFVGSQVPLLTNSQTYLNQTTNGVVYTKVGTDLTMTPIINTEDRVVMDIQMMASQLEPGVLINGSPVIDSRNFTTMLAVENNQTIVIGGIMSEQSVENIRRMPILGYIPVLDWVFAKKDKERLVTEIIAFITPVVLRGPADANKLTHDIEEGVKQRQEWPILPPEKGEMPDNKGIGGESK